MSMIRGTSGGDTINATDTGDTVKGLGGDDSVSGGAGDDSLYGGAGSDSLWGAAGLDHLYGGGGDDLIAESEGGDVLVGGGGHDTLSLFYGTFFGGGVAAFDWSFRVGAGQVTPGGSTASGFESVDITGSDFNDTIAGGRFDDALRGWQGDDQLSGGRGDDFLIGDNGADTLSGGAGDDSLSGGGGGDVLYGGKGDDTLVGGNVSDVFSGNDTLVGGAGADTFYGGPGRTTVSYADSSAGVQVDIVALTATGGDAEGDSFHNFGGVLVGSDFADVLGGAVELESGGGDDQLVAGYGTRLMTGGEGRDSFVIQFDSHILYEHPVIADFDQAAGETIDLSRIDARAAAGDQAFRFIGTAAFDGTPGEARYEVVDGRTMIQLSTDQDTDAEHTVWLDGVYVLTAADLVL